MSSNCFFSSYSVIVAMAAAMPQVVTNMGANDIVYGTSVDEQGSPNQS